MKNDTKAVFGVYGLSVMGGNLARNIAGKGFLTAVYTRSPERIHLFSNAYAGEKSKLIPCHSPAEFCRSLSSPRRILIMVKAGEAVDSVITNLLPFLEPGDILIDGGNSRYTDTLRRADLLESSGINFVGMGVSGGKEGALYGPSLMPGATPEVWEKIKDVLEAIAAKAPDGTPCCRPLGTPAAGHFVKMVHNGIEYADMQIIAECWEILKYLPGTNDLSEIFHAWNQTELESFLIEITAGILKKKDPVTGKYLVDMVVDKAGQKGTGLWTSYASLDFEVPAPGITESVFARMISIRKDSRCEAATILSSGTDQKLVDSVSIDDVGNALYAAKICTYAQGFSLFFAANEQYEWELDPVSIASVWRRGCIIRSAFLEEIISAYANDPAQKELMLLPFFSKKLNQKITSFRKVVSSAISAGIPIPVLSAQLAYYDSMRSAFLPANLIQAQRDCFGAHLYERIDVPGELFHSKWL